MNHSTIEIGGQHFDKTIKHFSFKTSFFTIEKMEELEKLAGFPNLKSAGFCDTNLNDLGLKYVCANENIDNLDLQATQITDEGLQYLGQLKNLKHLRLKENDQLTNACIPYLNQLQNLENLQIHETSINQEGLKLLTIKNLKNLLISIDDENFSKTAILEFSRRHPTCEILAKGEALFYGGFIINNDEEYEVIYVLQKMTDLIKLPTQREELFGGAEQFYLSNQVDFSIENQESILLKVDDFENNPLTNLAQIIKPQLFSKIITAGNFQKPFQTYRSKHDLGVYYAYYTTSNHQYLIVASLGEKQPHLYLFCLEAIWRIVT